MTMNCSHEDAYNKLLVVASRVRNLREEKEELVEALKSARKIYSSSSRSNLFPKTKQKIDDLIEKHTVKKT